MHVPLLQWTPLLQDPPETGRGKGEQEPNWQLPPGHWESKEQVPMSGGKGEQVPRRQLPPGHWESKAHVLASGGKGEHEPKRQLPPGHSESKLHVAGPAVAAVDGACWPAAQPTSTTSSAPSGRCLIVAPSLA